MCHGGCSSDIASSYFLRASKVWSMLHRGSVGASSEYKKRNLTLTLRLPYYLLLYFMIKFDSLSWFLRLYHFYGLFTAYFLYEEVISVRLYACHYVSFFPYENGVPKCWKKRRKTNCESFWNILLHQFRVLVTSRKCDMKTEKWGYINPDKSGVLLLNNRNFRSFNSRFLFSIIIFVWILFKDVNFVIFSADVF